MNVYDFDETLIYPNSSVSFITFCIKRHPKIFFRYFPKLIKNSVKYFFRVTSRDEITETLFSIVKHLDDIDYEVKCFWEKYEGTIKEWYLKQKKSDDLIISGSPEFLLKPMTDKLGVRLIGTIINKESGTMEGKPCYAREKARHMIEQELPVIDNFYSDSLTDTPIALLSEHAFLVSKKATKIEPWPHFDKKMYKKVEKKVNGRYLVKLLKHKKKINDDMDYKIIRKSKIIMRGYSKIIQNEKKYEGCINAWYEHIEKGRDKLIEGTYALSFGSENKDSFKYFIGDEFSLFKIYPKDIEKYELEKGLWAIFPCVGPVPESLIKLSVLITNKWLPNNRDFKLRENMTMIYYSNNDRGASSANYYSELWIPVEKR